MQHRKHCNWKLTNNMRKAASTFTSSEKNHSSVRGNILSMLWRWITVRAGARCPGRHTTLMRYIHRTDPADLDCSARYLERAIELDPELGEPYPWLTYAYMRQGKVDQAVCTGHKGVEKQPDLVLSHYFLGAAYLARSERDAASYQAAAKHLLDATLTDARWGAAWLCLGESHWCAENMTMQNGFF